MKKLTKKEMFTLMQEAFEAKVIPENAADLADFCAAEIESLDRKAAKAKEYAAKKKADSDALTEKVAEVLTAQYTPVDEVVAALEADGVEVTKQKVVYRLSKLVEAGTVEKTQQTIPGGDGKKSRKITVYRLA